MKNILVVNNLTKIFGNNRGLKNISFEIPKGSIVGLIGPNGAGKSTIMKCILGIYPYSQGNILFENKNIKSQNNHSINKKIGSLIESPSLYPFLTGMQHFKLYSVSKSGAQNVIALLKMENYINEKVTNYSYGMKQKFGIALALVNNPDLIILDEPMNGLDLASTLEIRKIILTKSAEGTTFIVSSHILSELEKVVTHIILINHGRVVLQGPFQKLKNIGKQYYELSTSNNLKANKILLNHNFLSNIEASGIQVQLSSKNLNEALDFLLRNNVKIIAINHHSVDLETVALHYIQNKEGNQHA
ncbi:MAG: ATP-binding cassette domain-containing protein [Lentilactobacillus diolivorans]|uniref:ATP-binding cassette domain-containing protein n=1 Tax=Lentilactobacillus hilgardii TaxID=1588 RepID=A0A6P1E9A1_LENHI|nr:ATP-binding cassette domain-containing protein [Lentilactobacillus hilgardii]MCH4164963.1 ATP-binding cassette domain-containing protein [Lentilactobacillus diolivorans]MCT3391283.1 ATP-binding cassette domain-containing protein [Lentilactobacillus hilgardii]QHB53179.1 ATP-binding cassette domain-containing protein [Lentilactobacillus hilgardii]RRG11298.1 MAG: ATP-binding cassette domain-containing protein [Lactobacillus sp.]